MQPVVPAAWTAYSKIDQFIFLPIQSMGLAVTTFVGQNLGVNDTKRAKKGTYLALGMAFVSAVAIIIPIMIWAPFWTSIFNSNPDVVKNAAILLRCISPFYVCCCVNQVIAAALRGSGNTTAPMVIMLATFVGFRQLMLFVISTFISGNLVPIGMAYPLGWLACATTLLIYFSRFNMSKSRIVK
jgi:Na+-driven multidrug efflux pump